MSDVRLLPDARVAEAPPDQDRQPDDPRDAGRAACHHRDELVPGRRHERRHQPVRREKPAEVPEHDDEHAPMEQVAAEPQHVPQQLGRVAFHVYCSRSKRIRLPTSSTARQMYG
jgi:hypothetical protein